MSITLENSKKVLENRKNNYDSGNEDSFNLISQLWSCYLNDYVSPKEVAVMLALLKIARSRGGQDKYDNYVDGAAYMALAGDKMIDYSDNIKQIEDLTSDSELGLIQSETVYY